MLGVFGLIAESWSWMPGPLAVICKGACTLFALMLLYVLYKMIAEVLGVIINLIKGLLLKWGL